MTCKKYQSWIDANYPTQESAYGQCRKAVQKMIEAFSELREVKGHAETDWGQRQHFWCETPEGDVVDPTRKQYPGGRVYAYEEANEDTLVVVGPCAHCGEGIRVPLKEAQQGYRPELCSAECHDAYARYIMSMTVTR